MLAPMALDAPYADLVPFSSPCSYPGPPRLETGLFASVLIRDPVAIAAVICIVIRCVKGTSSRRKHLYSQTYLQNSIGAIWHDRRVPTRWWIFWVSLHSQERAIEVNTDPHHIDSGNIRQSRNSAFIVLRCSYDLADSIYH
jgi:hypothetical protein